MFFTMAYTFPGSVMTFFPLKYTGKNLHVGSIAKLQHFRDLLDTEFQHTARGTHFQNLCIEINLYP
jgi:hypothetical protein